MMLLFPTWIAPSLAYLRRHGPTLPPLSKKSQLPRWLPQFLLATPGLPGSCFSLLPPERINQSAPSPPLLLKPPAT